MIYKIKKNRHRSSFFIKITDKSEIKGSFMFIGDCSYYIEDNQKDSNKLIGLSDNISHHFDSIRIGWRYNNGLELTTIAYCNKERIIKPLGRIKENVEYNFKISIFKGEYYIHVWNNDSTLFSVINRHSKWRFLRVVLKPYFGGKIKAPKEFKIYINHEKS